MKNFYSILASYLFCVLLFGCDKPLPEEVPIVIEPTILWRAPQGADIKLGQNAPRPYLYNNKVLIGYQKGASGNGFYAYDKSDGTLVDNINVSSSYYGDNQFDYNNQFMYISDGFSFETLNLENQEVNITNFMEGCVSDAHIEVFGDNIYLPFSLKPKGQPNKFGVLYTSLAHSNSKLDTLFVHEFVFNEDAFEARMGIPLVQINSVGDTMMYFMSKYNGTDKTEESILYIQSYNISNRQMAWSVILPDSRIDDKLPLVNLFSFIKPIIVGEKLYIASQTNLFCFDLNEGKILWKRHVEELSGFSMIHVDGYFFTLNQIGTLNQVDALTGEIVGEINDLGNGQRPWIFHKGIIYFTTSMNKLYALDADKNEIIWSIKSPNQSNCCTGFFGHNSPIIDPETDNLYIADNWEIFCYKLPEL